MAGSAYSGVGSRETPGHILAVQYRIAQFLAPNYLLRSGHAKGSDLAFENGAIANNGAMRIYTANEPIPQEWFDCAAYFHPAWDRCSDYAKKLHARNCPIVLGDDLKQPVKFGVCWTKDGKATGGTGQAIRIATHFNIPFFNMRFDENCDALWSWLNGPQT